MTDVQKFRVQVLAWLKTIAGLAAYVQNDDLTWRIYYAWPHEVPAFPLITFVMSRTPVGDFATHGWQGQLTVSLHAEDGDTLDEMERLLFEAIAMGYAPVDYLSDATYVNCHYWALISVGTDEATISPEDGAYVFLTRPLSYQFVISPKQ